MTDRVRLVITGGPGVGKHTNARLIAKKLRGSKVIDINKVAITNDAILETNDKYGHIIDTNKVSRLLDREADMTKNDLIFVGHLAPYVLKPHKISLVAVLRRSPYELISVFQKRHYSPEQARENIASEILGITLFDALKTFGKYKIVEIDTTGGTQSQASHKIVSILQEKSTPRSGFVDWLPLISRNNDVQRFLEY